MVLWLRCPNLTQRLPGSNPAYGWVLLREALVSSGTVVPGLMGIVTRTVGFKLFLI